VAGPLAIRTGDDAMTRYARDTDVSVEASRAEIERMIIRYGATATAFMNSATQAIICFEARGRRIMFKLPLPSRNDRAFTHSRVNQYSGGEKRRSEDATMRAWEKGCRQRWRALALVIKAKLEAVESGITTFEDEFLAHIVLPDGQTIGDTIKPRIKQMYESGTMTPLLPPPGG
jgi:hypothetical protein